MSCHRFFGQSISLVPALGCLRAHARLAGKHAKRKRISRGHDENAQGTIHQDCRAGQGDENESKGRVSCCLSRLSNHRKLFSGLSGSYGANKIETRSSKIVHFRGQLQKQKGISVFS